MPIGTLTGRVDILDHGFVRLVDWYGSDQRIVDAARVSIAGEGVEAKTKNEHLIRYLMRHRHTTPFEMVDFTFHVKVPIFVTRQWHRHRTFSYNEMSGRYSELPEEYYVPKPEDVNFQAPKNKQGRDDRAVSPVVAEFFIDQLKKSCVSTWKDYHTFLGHDVEDKPYMLTSEFTEELREGGGIARELSRVGLGVNTYTEFYAKGNLHNWFHFLGLRLDSHAQFEIREPSQGIAKMIQERVPIAYGAFEDYRLNAMSFSRYELEALLVFIDAYDLTLRGVADRIDFPTKREKEEFMGKLAKLFETRQIAAALKAPRA